MRHHGMIPTERVSRAMTQAPTITADEARRAARNVGALVVASIFSKGLLFGWQIVLGRWLGPADYGIYNTVFAFLAIGASVAYFGTGLIAIREVAKAPETIGKYAAALLSVQMTLSLVAYGGVILAALVGGYSEAVVQFVMLAGLSLIVDTVGNVGHDLLLAQERMVATSLTEIGHIVLRIALAFAALAAGWGIAGVYLAMIASAGVRFVVLWGLHRRSGLQIAWREQGAVLRPLLVNAAPLALTAFLALAYTHADKLMTTRLIGETSTGYLGPAYLINLGLIELLSTTVLVAMYPLLSRTYDADQSETFGFIAEKLTRFTLLVTLPIVLALSLYADDIIAFLFQPEYAPTIGILRIYVWYTLLTMVGNVLAQGLLVQNRQRLTLSIRVVSLSLNIALNGFLLLRYRDPRGAALASVAAEALTLFLYGLSFRASGFAWRRVWPSVLRVVLVGCLAAAAMLWSQSLFWLVSMALGGLVYVVGILLVRVLTPDDWDLLYRIVVAMPGGGMIRRWWQREVAIHW